MTNLAIPRRQTVLAGSSPLRILVGDDQSDVLEALRLLLKSAGHQTVAVDSPAALFRASQESGFDLVLMDLNYARDTTSGQEGLDLLRRLHASGEAPPVVVMTAWGNIELAVEAMRRGAVDFVQKPWDNAKLLETIQKQSRRHKQTEMDLARHVQGKLFPRDPISLQTLECVVSCVPAMEVSGDYYDFLRLGPNRAAFILADVSGKGMASALLMANLQGSFRSQSALAERGPLHLLSAVNQLFYDSTPPERYATLFYGEYNGETRQFQYINAGHQPGILIKADGSMARLESNATVIGLFRSWTAAVATTQLDSGDTLVLFSDGVTEAGIESGLDYGEERLISLLRAMRREKPDYLLERVLSSVETFSAGRQHDDRTVMILRSK